MKNRDKFLPEQKTWSDIEDGAFCIVGSPETVRQKLEHYQKEIGCGVVLTGCQTGPIAAGRTPVSLAFRDGNDTVWHPGGQRGLRPGARAGGPTGLQGQYTDQEIGPKNFG